MLSSLLGAMLMSPSACAQPEREAGYCRYSERATMFLIDRTSQYDEVDQAVVRRSLGSVIDDLEPGERIELSTIGRHYSASESVFDGCMPGCPPTNNPLAACSGLRAQRDARVFRHQLQRALRPLMDNEADVPNSDITGTIARLTRNHTGTNAMSRFILFSDMLENSQALPWSRFRTNSVEESMVVVEQYHLTPQLSGAEIAIYGFGRSHDPGRPPLSADLDLKLRNFWQAYFSAGGAAEIEFRLGSD
jgi:hypothetical protein